MKKNARNKLVCLALALALLLGCALGAWPAGARSLAWENPFTDVEESDWFYPHVQWAAGSGVLSGTNATTFEPDAPMTRGMFVTALANWEGIDPAQYPGSRFQDVAEGAWYAAPIQWAASWGIASGTGQGDFTFDSPTLDTFSPLAPLTRQDAAVILYQYAQLLGADTETTTYPLNRFPDGWDTARYARDAMAWGIAQSIFKGSDGKLLPGEPLTRAQAAAVLHKFANELYSQDMDETALGEAPVHPVPDAGYLLGDIIYRYRIPEVELPGVDTAQVNQEIQNAYGQLYEDAIASMEQGIAPVVDEIGYFWNVRKYGDKILSLVTWERSNETNYRFRVWNISMETGQQWNTGEAVLELSADSLKGYELAAQEALDAAFDKWVEFRGTVDAGLVEELRQQTLSPENLSLEGVPLFFGTDGQLWMAGCVWHDVGSQRRFVCLPLGSLSRFWGK
ncbi:MAG: S-layer homology domain-containing protein [Acutalibacter sp.]